ncbi:beta-mannosidase [Flavobacteriaceae bacterium TP-CH-4]|uniref:Beta-mannosidase n=1 Tax=Pelagihabitans pacificus TaxID=2696054 RepID=A0A967ASP0_9FLAO|nr:glycosyl hydrolase [Pelagihabitans pacificus]NHF59543.1 beta-mannosidase [Pelagihabitans pacificus]
MASPKDRKITKPTRRQLQKLRDLPKVGYAFGHQDALTYGIGWKNDGKQWKSDVQLVCGEHPAVFGFELGNLERGLPESIDSVNFGIMKKLIRKAYRKGGIVTLSWHPDNPVSNKNAWDTTRAVHTLLRGGTLYGQYRIWMTHLARFLKSLKDKNGKRIPIVFRPYHEMNGSWFWWGKGHCSTQEYTALWRQTFHLLTNEFDVHNLLYCYSPNLLMHKKDYLKYYPGDAYVDVLGIDVYQHINNTLFKRHLKKDLRLLKKIAEEKDKPFALTETGLEKIGKKNWFTKVLHPLLVNSGISYAVVWRNDSPGHHYAPYPEHPICKDFITYAAFVEVLFLKDI